MPVLLLRQGTSEIALLLKSARGSNVIAVHVLLQRSPLSVLPSSHCSRPVIEPLPQVDAGATPRTFALLRGGIADDEVGRRIVGVVEGVERRGATGDVESSHHRASTRNADVRVEGRAHARRAAVVTPPRHAIDRAGPTHLAAVAHHVRGHFQVGLQAEQGFRLRRGDQDLALVRPVRHVAGERPRRDLRARRIEERHRVSADEVLPRRVHLQHDVLRRRRRRRTGENLDDLHQMERGLGRPEEEQQADGQRRELQARPLRQEMRAHGGVPLARGPLQARAPDTVDRLAEKPGEVLEMDARQCASGSSNAIHRIGGCKKEGPRMRPFRCLR